MYSDGFVEYNSNCEIIETVIENEDKTLSDQIDIKGDCSYTLVDVSAILNNDVQKDFIVSELSKNSEKVLNVSELKNSENSAAERSNNLEEPKILIDGKDKQQIANENERKYHCKTCPKKFKAKEHLNNHEKTHSVERPHKCKTCEKSSDGSNYVRCSKFVRSKAKIGCSSSIANR